ncbi:Glycosyltransferase involved in cell wall bisynthesis [Parasporobacterium paucivorans DSM 15970]|uniref:Glycosyltransferase involved in cell wall bisynthesis n=2 Tax=Parasporobacterium TaxID=115543 RepID=A0A1M6D2Y4_9FIRM|nr:Glycosyltransferase involved in cell wall bisynthesis [Parasporobacterium paucivorans DSM 15970]
MLKNLIYSASVILIIIISYKVYLSFHESDFKNRNYENIKMINSGEEAGVFSFAVEGSIENSIDVFQNEIIQNINSHKDIAFNISTGDAVLDGSEDKYRILNTALKGLNVPSVIGIGNSEISDGGARLFYKHFGPYYFSFVYGGSYFIFIDTTGTTAFDLQESWLSDELIKADDYSHIFVIMDKSPLKQDAIKNKDFRTFLVDKFSEHKVTGVFTNGNAFEENIEKGVTYYSSGGAGGLMLNASATGDYHYLKVDVTPGGAVVKPVDILTVSKNPFIKMIEGIWIYIHSVFYAQFVNLSLGIFAVWLIFLIMYRKVSKDVNYYRDFNRTHKSIDLNRKLNIAMFTNNYLPFVGGVPVSVNRLATALRKKGNRVVIFAPYYPGADDSNDDVVRCKLLRYKKTDKFSFAIANIYSKQISKEFDKYDFDVIHVHHPFWMGKKGLKLGIKKNIPVILTYHTRLEMYAQNMPIFKLTFKNILSHGMIKKFAQKCDGIIAPTESAKEYLENIGVSREKLVMPTGVDSEYYENIDECTIKSIKKTYAPNGEMLLCSVSRLSSEKNIRFLINGLKYIKENTPLKFKCIIIGDGPDRGDLQSLIDEYSLKDYVLLIGTVNQNEIPRYYLASDLFVFSSQSETQGMVLLEAMSGKCPVVCVRSSGTDDMVRNGFNGYKTSPDITEWAEKVMYLIENREILEKMSMNAFKYSKEFTLDKMAENVSMFYKKLISVHENETRENENV